MSKRISNKRSSRKTPARSRVSLGWKKLKMLSDLQKMQKESEQETFDEEMTQKFENFKAAAKAQLKSFFPKRVFRNQAR